MATWSGWQAEFLKAAGFRNTADNVAFLTQWASHSTSNCRNNPIDLSHVFPKSTNCHKLTSSRTAQNYTSHAQAATAFSDEVKTVAFNEIFAALELDTPLQVTNPSLLVSQLKTWGSPQFASWVAGQTSTGGGAGGTVPVGIHKGWADLQRSLGKSVLGTKISDTNRTDAATLRKLSHLRKVR